MSVQRHTISVTTDSVGAGTATSGPVTGHVLAVRQSGTALAGTATYTLTRQDDGGGNGGTILAYTATANPWQVSPREAVHTVTGGTTSYSVGGSPIVAPPPVDGYVKLVVAAAGSAVTGSVSVYVEG